MALPARNRLSGKLFTEVFAGGRVVRGQFFFLRRRLHTGGPNRFAISVSKKAAPRAVDRVRIRRTIGKALQDWRADIAAGQDIVIVVTKDVVHHGDTWRKELYEALRKPA